MSKQEEKQAEAEAEPEQPSLVEVLTASLYELAPNANTPSEAIEQIRGALFDLEQKVLTSHQFIKRNL